MGDLARPSWAERVFDAFGTIVFLRVEAIEIIEVVEVGEVEQAVGVECDGWASVRDNAVDAIVAIGASPWRC